MRLPLVMVTTAFAVASCATQSPPAVTSTVTVPPPVTTGPATTTVAAPTTQQSSGYSSDGAYAVGTQPSGGLQAAIPPGRYRVEWKPNEYDPFGMFAHCATYECDSANMFDPVFLEQGQLASVIEIEPTDVAVYLSKVTLVPVG